MLQVNGAHGGVARIADGAYALDAFVGLNMQDMDFVWATPDGLLLPDLAVVALRSSEIEVRRVGRQLENGDANAGDLHVEVRSGKVRSAVVCAFESALR